jgi:PAS domain S-box-containing protein
MEAGGHPEQWGGRLESAPTRYALAIGAACLALVLKLVLGDYLAPPYILFFGAVLLAALAGGLGPGIIATLVSAGLVYVFVFEPRFTLRLEHPHDLLDLGFFIVMGVLVSVVADRQRRAEARVRESEARLALAVRGGGLGLWDWDLLSGRCKYNERWAAMLGYSLDEIEPSASAWEKLLHPDDKARIQPALEANMRMEASSWTWEQRLRHKDGHWVWILGAGAIVERAPDGTPLRAAGTHADISVQKSAEAALAASEAKYRGLFGSLMDGFAVVDMDGVVHESNETFRKMLGYSVEELERLTYEDLTPERWQPVEARIVAEQILPRGFSDVYEKEYRRKDGTVFPAEIRTFLLKEDGRPVAMWAIVRDVTEARALQMKLAVAARMAALGTLVSGLAHEINNPLTAEIAGQGVALEVVREVRERLRADRPVDREAAGRALDGVVEALEDAQDGGARIAQIVKDMAVFGKPEARRQRAGMMDIVDGAMRWLPATVADSASVEVENGGAPDVIASAGQIEQVLVNLITNAAKATPEGQRGAVFVRVGPGRPGMARVEVIDHGTGIDPAIRGRIFDPFFTTRPTGPAHGTGLGLAICQAIAAAHGGTLTVESEVGKGSTFSVELPAAPTEA